MHPSAPVLCSPSLVPGPSSALGRLVPTAHPQALVLLASSTQSPPPFSFHRPHSAEAPSQADGSRRGPGSHTELLPPPLWGRTLNSTYRRSDPAALHLVSAQRSPHQGTARNGGRLPQTPHSSQHPSSWIPASAHFCPTPHPHSSPSQGRDGVSPAAAAPPHKLAPPRCILQTEPQRAPGAQV